MSKALRDAQVEKELSLLNKIIEQREVIRELRDALREVLFSEDTDENWKANIHRAYDLADGALDAS